MEYTGKYHAPVAWSLSDAGIHVSVVNAMLVHDYGNNSLRRAKTDKNDAVKLANYALDHWLTLPRYVPEEDTRLMLKNCHRLMAARSGWILLRPSGMRLRVRVDRKSLYAEIPEVVQKARLQL